MILRFRCPSAVEVLLLPVWATKLELLGHKSHAQAAQSRLGRASERGRDSQVRAVGSVWLSELWNPSQPSRNSSQVGGQSLSSRQVICLDLLYLSIDLLFRRRIIIQLRGPDNKMLTYQRSSRKMYLTNAVAPREFLNEFNSFGVSAGCFGVNVGCRKQS